MIDLDDDQRTFLGKMSVEEIHPTFVDLFMKWQHQLADNGFPAWERRTPHD